MSSKYMNSIESVFASFLVVIGAQTATDSTPPAPNAITIKDGVPVSDITINPGGQGSLGNTILVVCTTLSIGLPLLSMRAIEFYKSYKQVNDGTFEGKLSKCEEERLEDKKKHDEEMSEMRKHIASMAANMDSMQKSNEVLNKTIAANVETITRLSAPMVVATSEVTHTTDT